MTLVRSERRGAVALVTLDRPDALNALDRALLHDLEGCIAAVASDPTVRALVVTGAGRAFAAGADIEQMRGMTPAEAEGFSRLVPPKPGMMPRFTSGCPKRAFADA